MTLNCLLIDLKVWRYGLVGEFVLGLDWIPRKKKWWSEGRKKRKKKIKVGAKNHIEKTQIGRPLIYDTMTSCHGNNQMMFLLLFTF